MRTELQEALDASLERYSKLPMLARLAAQSPLVPPEGRPGSPLMLIGEAPGADEVRLGRPFVGKAGAQLDYALKRNNLQRDLVCWVTNAVLFRPPINRTPYPFEIQASRPRLEEELLLCLPVAVVALGAVAWEAVRPWAEVDDYYAEVRGREQEMTLPGGFTFRLMVTWHPAATFHKSNPKAAEELEQHIGGLMR